MTRPEVKVEGARELRRALKQFEGGIDDLKAAHADAAKIVADEAMQLVPRLSGLLESTIRSSGQASSGIVRAGTAGVPYAGVIHFGWPAHNIEPHPFLYDALDDRTAEVIEAYERHVDGLIDRYGLD